MLENTRPTNKRTHLVGDSSYAETLKNFLGNYIWRAVHALMDHQDFEASPIWISKQMKITIEEAAESLDGLVMLGLAERTAKGFEAKKLQFLIPEQEMEMETRMERHCIFSEQILNRLAPEKRARFKQVVAASNASLFKEFTDKVNAAATEFIEKSIGARKDGLYCFTSTGVDILESQNLIGGNQ